MPRRMNRILEKIDLVEPRVVGSQQLPAKAHKSWGHLVDPRILEETTRPVCKQQQDKLKEKLAGYLISRVNPKFFYNEHCQETAILQPYEKLGCCHCTLELYN
ncbi:UPF0061 protein Bphyt_1924 [Striga asiatica]|uniref:UPF0061 protein Bphyt_1924 n=1 Tax=Striga asiatica TaxID=4170 RepID=A0A5A7R1W7_STRAF|nr:UPF0061 protein Bphyt_1924 [Striga asiatica]